MKLTDLFLSQLESEARRTRRAVEQVPDGRDDWAPHAKSMPFGRLALLVAGMPSWIAMIIADDHLDLNPPGGSAYRPPATSSRADRLKAFDDGVAKARAALEGTTDEHLMKPWRLLVAGKVVSEDPRHVVLRDTFLHLAHHRGQLTVYLRLNDLKVPAIYGPSADENRFD
ncbi:MAG TPA: DinB family protein [Candidatus Eisenbacteria bacterium]